MPEGNNSNKNRKYDKNRNSPGNKAYIIEGRKRKNKVRRINRHLKKYPNDNQARGALK